MNQGKYRTAYSYISKPLQQQMTYGEFHDAAERVKSIRLLSVVILHQNIRYAKARVTVENLENTDDEKKWKKRKHMGELVLIPEKEKWRIIQVDLKQMRR